MNHFFFAALFSLLTMQVSYSQTAVNFTLNDCTASPHDLFSELDGGTIVILTWVMPCPGCVEGSFAASNVASYYETLHPGKVVLYIVDDYGNSPCHTVNDWVIDNNVTATAVFSDPAISMSDYGVSGMPKVVVLGGGTSHTVFYNQNNTSIDSLGIDLAIQQALLASTTELSKQIELRVFPNPSSDLINLTIQNNSHQELSCVVKNNLGQIVSELNFDALKTGETNLEFNTKSLSNGVYFIEVNNEHEHTQLRFEVIH